MSCEVNSEDLFELDEQPANKRAIHAITTVVNKGTGFTNLRDSFNIY